jgi:hypothetical protein
MVEGTDDQDYYEGKVSGATPEQRQYAASRTAATDGGDDR